MDINSLHANFYRAFEEKFRGSRETVRARLEIYSAFLNEAFFASDTKNALDLGCGRGEWLEFLADHDFNAVGVDLDEAMLSDCRERNLNVLKADALEVLAAQETSSLSVISGFHIAEHLAFDKLQMLIAEALRALRPGGLLILETPNPENLKVSSHTFHMDPTHQSPIPPSLLHFMTEYYGFARSKIIRLQEPSHIVHSESVTIADVYDGVSPDYAVVAQKGGDTPAFTAVDDAFSVDFGISNDAVFDKYQKSIETIKEESTTALAASQSVSRKSEKQGSDLELLNENIDIFAKSLGEISENALQTEKRIAEIQAGSTAFETTTNQLRALEERAENLFQNLSIVAQKLDKISVRQVSMEQSYLSPHRNDNEQARVDELERALASMHNSTSWKITSPIRMIARRIFWLKDGTLAWVTLRPGARPYRALRRMALTTRRIVAGNPNLHARVLRTLERMPALQLRLRKLISPSHLQETAFAVNHAPHDQILVQPRSVRLAATRLEFAATQVDRVSLLTRSTNSARPRLAYFSPLPPEKSGVADYSAQLLPKLATHYEITIISDHEGLADVWQDEGISVNDIAWFRSNYGDFDRIVYHVGNSLLHSHMLPLLKVAPGVVVLHDFYLGSLIAYLELYGGWGTIWTESLNFSHGYDAIVDRTKPDSLRRAIDNYPSNFEILSKATGIIVHSQHPLSLANKFYPAYSTRAWEVVPLPRIPPETRRKSAAREALGIADDEILVCTFGFLGPTKLNHRLLDAWLSSSLGRNDKCRLVYVGEANDDSYCQKIVKRIAAECAEQVNVAGYVSHETYRLYLEAADIGVQLRTNSRGETSAAVLDCMAYGIATIANANGSMAELSDDAVVLIEDNFDDAALAAALDDLVLNEEKRRRFGMRAAAYVKENHSVKYAAERYHAAIEKFYASSEPLQDHSKLIEYARRIPNDNAAAALDAAKELAASPNLPRTSRQILVDVSALRNHDLRTGIQRVVRSVLAAWLKTSPDEQYRIQPVWLSEVEGKWCYNYAHQFTMAFLGWPRPDIPDAPVDIGEGDIFIGLDHYAHGVTRAAASGLYEDLRKRGAHIAFVVYDILPVSMPHNFPAVSSKVHAEWLEAICSVTDKLICISQAVANDVERWLADTQNPRANQIETVAWHLGADIIASSPTTGLPNDSAAVIDKMRKQRAFLMVGTIEPRKGYAQVIDAFEQLWSTGSQDVLVLVGAEGWKGVPKQQARNLPAFVARLRKHPELGKRLIWLENASDEYLARIYAEADALIVASEGEGFGLPLIEAAQHGLPILSRDLAVFREVAGDGAFYFQAASGDELANAVNVWSELYINDQHPKSELMKWMTWAESAEALFSTLDGTTRKEKGPASDADGLEEAESVTSPQLS